MIYSLPAHSTHSRFVLSGAALLLALSLAGCFRPAGEEAAATPSVGAPADSAAQSAGNSAGETGGNSPTLALTMVMGTGAEAGGDTASGGATPAMTMAVFNQNDAPTALPTNAGSGGDNALPITIIAPGTPYTPPAVSTQSAPGLVADTALTPGGTVVTVEMQFITPFSPLSPITPNAITAAPVQPGANTPSGLITPTSLPGTSGDDCLYIIQAGDSLYGIALESDEFTLEDLRAANPDLTGENPLLDIGQQINLPCPNGAGGAVAGTTAPVNTTPLPPPSGATAANPLPPGSTSYTVQAGDTLYSIALDNGVTVQQIINANNLTNPDRLDIGDVLIIPAGE